MEGNTYMFGMYAWLYEQESQRISLHLKQKLKMAASKVLLPLMATM